MILFLWRYEVSYLQFPLRSKMGQLHAKSFILLDVNKLPIRYGFQWANNLVMQKNHVIPMLLLVGGLLWNRLRMKKLSSSQILVALQGWNTYPHELNVQIICVFLKYFLVPQLKWGITSYKISENYYYKKYNRKNCFRSNHFLIPCNTLQTLQENFLGTPLTLQNQVLTPYTPITYSPKHLSEMQLLELELAWDIGKHSQSQWNYEQNLSEMRA